MPPQIRTSIVGGMLALACLLGGCTLPPGEGKPAATTGPHQAAPVPPHIAGTVAEHAMLVGGADLPVRGYGLVAGLGTNGSREVPSIVREYFDQLLLKTKELTTPSGYKFSPELVLNDLDTAVVSLWGRIPPGAPVGTRFDVLVAAPPETQTRSLDGGVMLLPGELYLSVPGNMAGKQSKVYGKVDGTIFVNPFLDAGKAEDVPRLREGRVIGGGVLLEARPLRLFLLHPDYQRAGLIQRRLNERFGPERVAAARDSSTIEITIPAEHARDYQRFLRLLMHVPIRQVGATWETKAREIAAAMESSEANHDELALVWEAIGRQVLPTVQPLYESPSPVVAYYAARTGLRLGDIRALPVVAAIAGAKDSPLRMAAIDELGYQKPSSRVTPVLRRLLDDENESVRFAACDALTRQGDGAKIKRIAIKDQFDLDLVESAAEPMIYVSQSLRQRIVVFGRDITIRRPMFFSAPDDLVTLSATEGQLKLTAFRKVPRTGRRSEAFEVEPSVGELVRLLGTVPSPEQGKAVYGLGLTYSQVAGVLYRLCKSGDIPAGFRLQELPEVRRIYSQSEASAGRADVPGP
ncbi:MAG: flagellar basal body P-ring protein FlgI [Phycisphaerae bacterium]|nr:flagellar basal body P-ring protein FlgI [Phycisphaerae bacterium]